MKVSDTIIKEIADDLDCGMRCYLHKDTGELKSIMHQDDWMDLDVEDWEDDMAKLNSNPTDYIEFEKMDNHNMYKVMEDFATQLKDTAFKDTLLEALNKSNPFKNFKWQIENSDHFRQQWFVFKKSRYIDYVKRQLDVID
ncbi:UPF0158 family protein [Formosa algae]|uniref:UPF0158 family protein n=1 Tax=Formosa algae TaxID=225843 RepID=UPI000CCEC3A6|nr:UPF0158 family protein [Formosa algae]PNW26332.1 hypothetical protein BKP44_17470 [Formosa algae]